MLEMVETIHLCLAVVMKATTLVRLLPASLLKTVKQREISRMMMSIVMATMPREPKQIMPLLHENQHRIIMSDNPGRIFDIWVLLTSWTTSESLQPWAQELWTGLSDRLDF